jgi:hypothetical protein
MDRDGNGVGSSEADTAGVAEVAGDCERVGVVDDPFAGPIGWVLAPAVPVGAT